MRINTNTAALRACYQLNNSDSRLSASLGKLTSGSKITDIRENPVGASLSVKMKTQVRNLNRASQNTSDGISVVQTAEGALSEIQAMLQRMNELVVQGASETYTDDDRTSIMEEIKQLNEEIDRISKDTDFNTRTLLDGGLSRNTYTNRTEKIDIYVTEGVKEGVYCFSFEQEATKATVQAGTFTAGNVPNAVVDVNGAKINLTSTDTLEDVYEKYIQAADKVGLEVKKTGDTSSGISIEFVQKELGSDYGINIKTDEKTATLLGMESDNIEKYGKDAEVISDPTLSNPKLSDSAVIKVSGNNVTVTDISGFEMEIDASDELKIGYVYVNVANAGAMSVQTGANEYQTMEIEIPRIDSTTLKTNMILAYTSQGCTEAINTIGKAINRVSKVRGDLGAYQNRMEYNVLVVDATEENMTASLSRIEDVDMAKEMTQYTTYNVITQAATSMLAQANQLPEKVLQLLN